MTNLLDFDQATMSAFFAERGDKPFRAKQTLRWIHHALADRVESMTDLARTTRDALMVDTEIRAPLVMRDSIAGDGTRKWLLDVGVGNAVEAVYIPETDRGTLCVSSQAGCALDCSFCSTGKQGFNRNLSVGEIIGQLWMANRALLASDIAAPWTRQGKHPITNVVMMGMGEPLANFDNLLAALKILNAPWGGGIGARKITVSTSGLAPQIRRLADEPVQFRLAISLHGATDETRNKIMPVNRKFPLSELAAACDYYQQKKGRMITFEYILIAGVNDGLDQVKPLAQLARRLNAKVNLIPYNKVEDLPWERPSEAAQEKFLAALEKQKVIATLRREKGGDIDAACGQLRLKTERELAEIKN